MNGFGHRQAEIRAPLGISAVPRLEWSLTETPPYGLMCFMAPLALTGPVYGFPSNRKSFHLGGRGGQNQQQCHSFC